MKQDHLGIFYLDYADVAFPRSRRKLIIGYTRSDLLQKMQDAQIPNNYFCWLQECRTPGYLVEGNADKIRDWIDIHISEAYGEKWNDKDIPQG